MVNRRKVPAKGTRWRARWRTPDGHHRKKTFDRKIDAERHLATVTTAKLTGGYVDPAAGRITFQSYAEDWRERQPHQPHTVTSIETSFRCHVYPVVGDRPLASIRPSAMQALVRELERKLAGSTVRTTARWIKAVFNDAVRDGIVASSPCDGLKLPKDEPKLIVPLDVDQVRALANAMPERYRALVIVTAGTGLRRGEALGLTVDRVRFLRRELTVDRQLVKLPGEDPKLARLKTNASYRTIPLPKVVLNTLSRHLAAFPSDAFTFTNDDGELVRPHLLSDVWRPAVDVAGVPQGTTFKDLRHHYASLLIQQGASVKAVQARLGHASARETLRTYGHLWPDEDDRTRDALDAAWSVAPQMRQDEPR